MDVAQPLSEAFIQINRYANLRVDDYGIKEGEERLFYSNHFNIVTHGNEEGLAPSQESLTTI
jgi:type I restriction enzyme R subunit